MATRRVIVIGGGPAGLFASRLLARRHPSWEITLFERLPPLETFGFGVGLSGGTLRALRNADEAVHADVLAEAFEYSTARFRLPAGDVFIPHFHSGVAIGRARMLQVLHRRAVESGVAMRVGSTAVLDDMRDEADLVIAADGASSGTRQGLTHEFGARVQTGRGQFIWCGSDAPLDGMVFAPVTTEHGFFVAHAYPYAPGRSTWVVETDERSWRRAGFDTSSVSEHGNDERAVAYLSAAFAEVLQGRKLTGNKSQWAPFRTVRCDRWSHRNVVLLGDAAANAHPSLGSGTKLALEDAIALDRVLDEERSIGAALERYDAERRPHVERFQERAQRSQLWWESVGCRLHLSPERLAIAFLTRAGIVSVNDLMTSAPSLVRAAAAQFAGVARQDVPHTDLARWLVDRAAAQHPSRHVRLPVDCADPWSPAAAAFLDRVRELRTSGDDVVDLVGPGTRSALLDRLALAERIRSEMGVRVHVAAQQEHLDDIADGLVAGRADLTSVAAS